MLPSSYLTPRMDTGARGSISSSTSTAVHRSFPTTAPEALLTPCYFKLSSLLFRLRGLNLNCVSRLLHGDTVAFPTRTISGSRDQPSDVRYDTKGFGSETLTRGHPSQHKKFLGTDCNATSGVTHDKLDDDSSYARSPIISCYGTAVPPPPFAPSICVLRNLGNPQTLPR